MRRCAWLALFLCAATAQAQDIAREAARQNDLGVAAAHRGDAVATRDHFDQAISLADDNSMVIATAALNRGRLALPLRDTAGVERDLGLAAGAIEQLPQSAESINARLGLGALWRDGQRQLSMPADWRLRAFEQFRMAGEQAAAAGEKRLQSYSLGYIGGLYADEGRHVEALDHSRRAAFLAQEVNADEALYRWQWQSAQALRALGEINAAGVAYRQSIATLERLRPSLAAGGGPGFRERAAPVFFEYADMLLARTASISDPQEAEANLREVRATLEQIKVAEVQDYFEDQCVAARGEATELDMVGSTAAILYPIVLPDRTELLVSLPQGLRQFTSPVPASQLTAEVRSLREQIERYDGRTDFLQPAQRLYSWLIAPMQAALDSAGIDTLVIVPDGALRTIPLSALHDGQKFLVERYALATTPGLTLTSPRPLQREQVELLAGGLTEGVQGFSALPNVGAELESISQEFPSRTFQDEDFLVGEVERQIAEGDQAIVHIATHGQFDSDHTKSFLLAWDDKFTMDRLQSTIATRQFQDEPLELLVLSACQTAAGDDRAALGLAGVALKAGARSALATLWFVNDESTARMVTDFYRHLGDPAVSKAEALRQAQLALINDRRFSHPSFWAPFLLIGNWL